MSANLKNSAKATGLENVQSQRRAMPKNFQTTKKKKKITLIAHANKAMLKILQDRLLWYVN